MKQKKLNTIKGFTQHHIGEDVREKIKSMKSGAGFTLVELLVVVAIIAILSVIGLTIFTSAQSNARDARRKADIDAIVNAIEVNRTVGDVYYKTLPSTAFSSGAVPLDNNDASSKPHYCIRTSVSTTTVITVPTTTLTDWDSATACPGAPGITLAGTAGESPWTDIGSWGLGAGGTAVANNGTGTVKGANAAASKFGTNVTQFVVCARLENTSTTALSVYCKPGSQ